MKAKLDIDTEHFNMLSQKVESLRINFPENYLKNINQNIDVMQSFDFGVKHMPPTRKSSTQEAVKMLTDAYKNGSLTLVLGSGVSAVYGLPGWDFLLQRLLIKTIEDTPEKAAILSRVFTKIFNPSPLSAGRYLQESLVDQKVRNKFEEDVRNALYETYNEKAESKIMSEIVKLCVAPGYSPNLDSIITYNYDDVLEMKLRQTSMDVPFQSIYGQGVNPDDSSLEIYHVHGYLPKEGKLSDHNRVTLGEYVYHEQYNNIYSWNNIVQINKFRDKTCLFIGSSLSDPNTRRLLDIANMQKRNKKFHYIIKKKPDVEWVALRLKKLLDDNQEIFNEKLIEKMNFNETLDLLIKIQMRFEEKDSESLGVKTVWIDDYEDDISSMLQKIREKA